MAAEKVYEVIITTPAQRRYEETILQYLMENFSIERVKEIDLRLVQKVSSLSFKPFSGTKEKYLAHLKEAFRFILHKESRNFEIKILYFVDEESHRIYVTDFFPTKMNPERLSD